MNKQLLNFSHHNLVFKRRQRVLATCLAEEMESGSVLDVGCGDGSIAALAMRNNPKLHFKGIDVFLRPDVAIEAQTYDGKTIPFENASFDWVSIVDVLHHTDEPKEVLRECARVARKGIVIKDHLREGLFAGATLRFMDWVGNYGHGVRLPYNYLSIAQWNNIFSNLELEPINMRISDIGIYPMPADLLFGRGLHLVTKLLKKI
jgi:SAM-dependent methyltransferase